MRLAVVALSSLFVVASAAGAPEKLTPIDQVFQRLYNCDFAGAHAILDESTRAEPDNPLNYSVRAATCLFAELDRLKILQADFFLDDDKLIDRRRLQPDAAVRATFYKALQDSQRIANARLSSKPNDPDALLALCMSSGVVADYVALVERKQWRSLSLAKQTNAYAQKLLALNPPMVDAYLNVGITEYVVGSLPFFVRWFVHYDQIQGNKDRGLWCLEIVARQGRYYPPFAKILLAVTHLREKRNQEAQRYLAEVAREYPGNPLIRRELDRVNEKISRGR
jgi:hypothetical protein